MSNWLERVSKKLKGSKNRKKAANKLGRFHKKITDKRVAYQWDVANQIVSRKVDAIALEDLNISGMLKRCKVKVDENTGRFIVRSSSVQNADIMNTLTSVLQKLLEIEAWK